MEQCPGGDISPDTAAPGSFARATGDGKGLDLQHLPLLIGGFSEPIRLQNINPSNRQPHIPVLGPESFWAPRAPQLSPPCTHRSPSSHFISFRTSPKAPHGGQHLCYVLPVLPQELPAALGAFEPFLCF